MLACGEAWGLPAKERVEVTLAVRHAKDQHILASHAVQDDIGIDGEGSPATAQVVTGTAYLRVVGNQFKPLGDGVNLRRSAISTLPLSVAMY